MNAGFLAKDDQRIHREQRAFLGWKSASGAQNGRLGTRTVAHALMSLGETEGRKWPETFGPLTVAPPAGIEPATFPLGIRFFPKECDQIVPGPCYLICRRAQM